MASIDKTKAGTIYVDIKFNTKISFWDALKLRLAGGKVIEAFLKEKLMETKEN